MCKVAFNHSFSPSLCFSQRNNAPGSVLDCFRVALPAPTLARQADTRRHLGEPGLKRIRQNLLLFIAMRRLPPSLKLCDFGELSATPPSPFLYPLLLWHFGLYSRLALTLANFVCSCLGVMAATMAYPSYPSYPSVIDSENFKWNLPWLMLRNAPSE